MEIEDSEGNRPGFTGVWIPAEIIERSDLTAIEVLTYGVVASFPKGCYLTVDDIEKRAKCKSATRRKALQHLAELGYLSITKQTNGRLFIKSTLGFTKPQNAPEHMKDSKTIKHPTSDEKSLETQNNGQLAQIKPQVPATKRNEDIDWAFEAWEQIVGVPQIANQKKNRYACHNLLKKQVTPNLPKGRETLESLIKLVRESKKDRFAPRIANFSELQGKLDNLMDWATRKREQTMGDENLIADLRDLGGN